MSTTKDALEKFQSFLSRKGLKMTQQRREIVTLFFQMSGHIGVEEVYLDVRKRDATIGFSTVYRTLKLLKEAGLARQVDFDFRRAKFEKWLEREHHDHLVCTECGRVVEFLVPEIERLQEDIAKKYGFVLTSHRMEMFGLCGKCAKK